MKRQRPRNLFLSAPLFFLFACQSQSLTSHTGTSSMLPAVTVNDSCSAYTKASDCQGGTNSLCTWVSVDACPAGATCPAGVCVTADPCSKLTTADACQGTATCAWSAIVATTVTPALCPVGQTCGDNGFCFTRAPSGSSCLCVQPLACPANGACPPVQCDCPPPPAADGGSVGGGGTCTCDCPACPPGEACPACACGCGLPGGCGITTGTGGATGGGGATGTGGSGTCTCNCPECPANADCAPCSCSCSNGSTTTMTVSPASNGGATGTASSSGSGGGSGSTTSGPGSVCGCPACPVGAACAPCECGATPADPCAAYTDATPCTADTIDACGWTSLNIECLVAPCPTGICARIPPVSTVDAGSSPGGGGCACACPACAPGETCPPCACNCCPSPAPEVTLTPPVAQAPPQAVAAVAPIGPIGD